MRPNSETESATTDEKLVAVLVREAEKEERLLTALATALDAHDLDATFSCAQALVGNREHTNPTCSDGASGQQPNKEGSQN
jgi:hypothetical protein